LIGEELARKNCPGRIVREKLPGKNFPGKNCIREKLTRGKTVAGKNCPGKIDRGTIVPGKTDSKSNFWYQSKFKNPEYPKKNPNNCRGGQAQPLFFQYQK
jgi:hypothetical protein